MTRCSVQSRFAFNPGVALDRESIAHPNTRGDLSCGRLSAVVAMIVQLRRRPRLAGLSAGTDVLHDHGLLALALDQHSRRGLRDGQRLFVGGKAHHDIAVEADRPLALFSPDGIHAPSGLSASRGSLYPQSLP